MTDFAGFIGRLKAAFACDCPVCLRHGEVHEQVPLEVFGSTVGVDRELAPLLNALRASSVLTVASCIDLGEAVAELVPENLAEIAAARDEPGVHGGRVVADRLVFVRMVDGGSATPFLEAAEKRGGIVTRSKLLAQVAFPRDLLPDLIAAAGS